MKIFWNVLLLIVGFASLIYGANYFVSGASAVAKKLKVPTIVIGLTVVAIGTSLPELAVSISSAISGSADLSVGNIVGSNLSNMLLILGIVAIVSVVPIKKSTKRFDLPFMLGATVLLLFFSADSVLGFSDTNTISWWEGLIFLVALVAYLFIQIKMAKKSTNNSVDIKVEQENKNNLSTLRIVLYLVFGLAGVVLGGEFVSRTSKFLAMAAGMSEALVGVTIVALGTSLPELVTSVVAARKGETDLAVGNIVGSNIMNIVMIIGAAATICNITISVVMLTDILILSVASVIFLIMCFTADRISKIEGFMLVTMYIAYMTYAIIRNYVLV